MNELNRLLEPTVGYLTLGMCDDAWEELENLPPELRTLDAVLDLRIEIYHRMGKWELARILAESLAKRNPGNANWWLHWAYSLRREKSVADAQNVLLEAASYHPNEALIPYNLGCYACVLGQIEAAHQLITMAITMDGNLKQTALDDLDLDPIFGENSFQPTPTFVPPHLSESDSP